MSSVEVAQSFFEEFPVYSEYKDSGIDWLGEIPKHWEVKQVKHVSLILIPQRNKPELNFDGGLPWITMDDITERFVNQSASGYFVSEDEIKKAGSKVLPVGCVITSCVGNFGIASVSTAPVVINQQLQVYLPKQINPWFLRYLISVSKGYFDKVSTATTLVYVNREKFGEMPVIVPTVSEQQLIATFLDRATTEIDQIIEQQKQLITLLEEERTTVISHAVTKGLDPSVPMKDSGTILHPSIPEHWTLLRLGYLCNKVVDGPHFSPNYVDEPEGIMFLSARNVKVDKWSLDDAKFISEKDYLEFSKRVIPEIGDILYTKGGTTGIARVVDLEFRFQVWVHIAVLKIKKERVNPYFLSYVLNGDICYQQSQLYTRGATNNDLGLTRLTNIVLAIPSLKEQEQIISFLDQETARIDEAIDNVRSQIEKLEEYRTVLISDAVTGKIDVRGFND